MRSKIILFSTLIVVAFVTVITCSLLSAPKDIATTKKLTITTSFYPLYYFTLAITGDFASVNMIAPVGAEPHDYEPTPKDIAMLTMSDIVIVNGAGFEQWTKNINSMVDPQKTELLIMATVMEQYLIRDSTTKSPDPHLWLNPHSAIEMVNIISRTLSNRDPQHSSQYQTRAQDLINSLEQLDQDYHETLTHCAKKTILSIHPAFGYLASEYGFTQMALVTASPTAEPSPQSLATLIELARLSNISIVFNEPLGNLKIVSVVAKELDAQILTLDPLETLTIENDRAQKNFLSVMRENLTNLKFALACAP